MRLDTSEEMIGTMGRTQGVKVSPSPSSRNRAAMTRTDWLAKKPASPVAEDVSVGAFVDDDWALPDDPEEPDMPAGTGASLLPALA